MFLYNTNAVVATACACTNFVHALYHAAFYVDAAKFSCSEPSVEKRLHGIIRRGISERNMLRCLLDEPRCDKSKDSYDNLVTKELRAAMKTAEAEAVGSNSYEDGDLLGLGYDLILCSNNYPDYDWHFLYHTISQNENTAIIEHAWSPEVTWQINGWYRLIKRGDRWLLDGILCYPDGNFNFSEDSGISHK